MKQQLFRYACLSLLASIGSGAVAGESINNEAEIRIQVDLEPQMASKLCQAQLELEWYQKGASVHVETGLNNETCGASFGSYVIQVRYRDADGKIIKIDFPETWERTRQTPVRTKKDYFVAENVDVVRVRSTKLRCECRTAEDSTDPSD